MSNHKVIHNASWLVAGKIVHKALGFIAGVMIARYLGPEEYGIISYAGAYTTFFAAMCTLGLNSILVMELLEKPEQEGITLGTSICLRIISSIVSVAAIALIVSVVDYGEPLTITVVILCSIGLVFQAEDSLNYWFQAHLESKYCAIATNISYLVVFLFQVALVLTARSVEWFAFASSIDFLVAGIFLLIAYRRKGGGRFGFSLARGKELINRSLPFIIASLMVSVYASTDRLMLKQMMDQSSVAFYSLACSLSVAGGFVLSAMIDSIYPTIVEAYGSDHELYLRRNRQLYAIVFYAAAAMSIIISLVAKPLILTLYGESYVPATASLRIVVWYTAFSYLGVARNVWVVCESRQRYLTYLYAASAGINVVLNVLLIPRWGVVGASVASLITEVATALIIPAMIADLRDNVRLMLDGIMLRGVLGNDQPRATR